MYDPQHWGENQRTRLALNKFFSMIKNYSVKYRLIKTKKNIKISNIELNMCVSK